TALSEKDLGRILKDKVIHFYFPSSLLLHLGLPECCRLIDPALRRRTGSQPESVAQTRVMMEFSGNSKGSQGIHSLLHGSPAGNSVALPHTGEGGRIVFCVIRMSRILHNDSPRPWKIRSSKRRRHYIPFWKAPGHGESCPAWP